MQPLNRAHLRKSYRAENDARRERQIETNLRILREGMSTRGRKPEDIEAMVNELEARLRGSRCNSH